MLTFQARNLHDKKHLRGLASPEFSSSACKDPSWPRTLFAHVTVIQGILAIKWRSQKIYDEMETFTHHNAHTEH